MYSTGWQVVYKIVSGRPPNIFSHRRCIPPSDKDKTSVDTFELEQ